MKLSDLDNFNGFRVDGVDPSDYSGYAVAGAGDINNDSFDDVIIGAYNARGLEYDEAGASYVVFGHAGGFPSFFSLSDLDGTNGFRPDPVGEFGRSGFSA
ncbi:integrin alpha [Acuticoccus sp. MNP-M23]|uniref:integrin alpha n=1 Tax=Acuticoccus sp. MNP-M23 TaxID=3072793 RepID=UPI002815152C|nr:integrin alpha [Acuticoccus sp. MNP-M23]WMS40969.1 integrin alpha [Acuticoccus sp. MNP-M23]